MTRDDGMTREECERVLLRAEKSQIHPSTGTLAAALRATLDREAKARDAALEEAARECEAADCAAPSAAWHGAQVACARRVRALKSPGAR